MWENYGNKVNAMFNKLDKLKSNKVENKKTVELGNRYTHNNNSNYINSDISLAEKVSSTLQNTYGKK